MQKFLWGILFTLLVIVVVGFLALRGGYFNFSADTETSSFEKKIAMSAMDKSTERRAPQASNPVQPNNDTLIAGASLYRDNCAGCHGDPSHMATQMGDSFNPPAPQFWMDAPDMPENENFYIIKHGVRWTGMPSWGKKLSDAQLGPVVTLPSHLDKLPDPVNQEPQKPAPKMN